MHAPTTQPASRWIIEQSARWPDGGMVLDLAAGYGRHTIALAQRFNVLAVDINPAALAAIPAHRNITRLVHDLEDGSPWGFAAPCFDGVVVADYLHRPRLADAFGCVKNSGFIAYETFAVGNQAYGKPSNPDYLLAERELMAAMPADFKLIDYFHGATNRPAVIQHLSAQRQPWGIRAGQQGV